ncbi:MAG: hypothetical protein IPL35_06480 [Sphingobacteriales bacterium]|nr:hypothetical protein [Sphingobacteriales bacterium]
MNILFITHDCSLSGAPLLLLHTIKWLRKNTTIQPIVLCLLSGPLYTEFSKIAHTFIFEKYAPITPAKKQENEIKKFFKKFFKKNASKNHHFIKHITDNPVSIIHGNTVIAGNVYQFVRQYANAPIISHLHELSGIINQHPSSWKFCLQYSDFFLGGSKACLNNLRNLGVATSKSGLCYDAIDIQQFLEKASIYQKSSYQQEYFTIGFCAHLFYRKGVDIFFS